MNDLILLIAPPASGKTFWIEGFAENFSKESLLIISPLRALANECKEKWDERIRVVTPEEWMLTRECCEIVIFDEYHLNHYWGDTFRPILWEVFHALAAEALLTVLLTATVSPEMMEHLKLMGCNFERMYLCDFGNRKLKWRPTKYRKAPSKKWLADLLQLGPRGGKTNLIFCAYRSEVAEWEGRLKQEGHLVWSCVGGEAGLMREYVKSGVTPDFIIATSVLSHGVNLPEISCVFFLYPLQNVDFWIQMVARGGRRGERYEVFALEDPVGIRWNRWINLLAILCLGFTMRVKSLPREIDQWFLKESS